MVQSGSCKNKSTIMYLISLSLPDQTMVWCMIPIYGDGLSKKAARYEKFQFYIFIFRIIFITFDYIVYLLLSIISYICGHSRHHLPGYFDSKGNTESYPVKLRRFYRAEISPNYQQWVLKLMITETKLTSWLENITPSMYLTLINLVSILKIFPAELSTFVAPNKFSVP